jgi:F-type H+-transporting ATPase subunit beta
MSDDLQLNVPLLRRRVPNLTTTARAAGLRPATVSNLCTGKTPVGRAEVRTLVTLASLAGCSVDDLIIRGSGVNMIETGIKVLDLFAPIVRGGTVGLVARPGMGQLVVLAELFRRMKQRGYTTIFWKPQDEVSGISDAGDEAEINCTTLDEVYKQISALRAERDILLGADRTIVLSGELLSLQERLVEAGARPVTIVLMDILGEAADEDVPYGPLDTLLQFDMDLATRSFYPAIDPVFSTSTVLEGAHLEATHLTIQQRARKLLRRYKELRSLVNARGLEKLSDTDTLIYQRGERLEAFLTQPLYVAEAYTKQPGEWLSVHDTLDSVRRILDGAADNIEADQLSYIGRLKH